MLELASAFAFDPNLAMNGPERPSKRGRPPKFGRPGQAVAITEGPFTDFNGTVEDVMADKGKVRVSVSLFGRPTSVELDYLQLRAH